MSVNHVVVDGSNLATEGRSLPSLQQLDEAVRAFIDDFEPTTVTVVVDASFPNRIDDSERALFEEAVTAGEIVSPPAGVIGRGDAFVLQIADRADAVVLSNDSFQEFHGQYGWLFDQGRLIGGKPVPHVGWVFMDRSPVRGPLSRRSMSDAKKASKASKASKTPASKKAKQATGPEPRAPKTAAPETGRKAAGTSKRGERSSRGGRGGRSTQAPATPAKGANLSPSKPADDGGRGRRRRGGSGGGGGGGGGVEPYNEALAFIEFVAAHPIGSIVEGEVERFSSHGAYIQADGARCYLPLKHLGDPPPRSAREVLSSTERYQFVVHAFDTPRRGVDLAIPGVVPVPTGEPARAGAASDPVPDQPEEERVAPAKKKATKKKSAAKKAPAKKKSAAKKAPAKKKSAAKRAPAKKKSAAKKAPAKKRSAAAKKGAATKKAAAKKRSAAAKKAPAKRKSAAKKATKKKATKKR